MLFSICGELYFQTDSFSFQQTHCLTTGEAMSVNGRLLKAQNDRASVRSVRTRPLLIENGMLQGSCYSCQALTPYAGAVELILHCKDGHGHVGSHATPCRK